MASLFDLVFGDHNPFFNEIRYRKSTPEVAHYDDGSTRHYLNGMLHNENGPAIVRKEGKNTVEEYFLHGERLSKSDWEHRTASIRDNQEHEIVVDGKVHRVKGKKLAEIRKLLDS
jgi:hypothetical protein